MRSHSYLIVLQMPPPGCQVGRWWVDHGFDPSRLSALFDDRNSSAAAGDDDKPRFDERPYRETLCNYLWIGRRDKSPVTTTRIFLDNQFWSAYHYFICIISGVKRSDRFARVAEGGIDFVNDCSSDNLKNLFLNPAGFFFVSKELLYKVTDEAWRLFSARFYC